MANSGAWLDFRGDSGEVIISEEYSLCSPDCSEKGSLLIGIFGLCQRTKSIGYNPKGFIASV